MGGCGSYPMSLLWYCARTNYNREWPVQKELTRQGINSFLPCYLTRSKSGNFNHNLLFRNYIFFTLADVLDWPIVKRTIGIATVLTYQPPITDDDAPWYLRPSALGSQAIESLRQQCLDLDEVRRNGRRLPIITKKQLLPVGCMVKILRGPFESYSIQKPIVEWSEKEKAGLILNMFGRSMVVSFFQKDLEQLEMETNNGSPR